MFTASDRHHQRQGLRYRDWTLHQRTSVSPRVSTDSVNPNSSNQERQASFLERLEKSGRLFDFAATLTLTCTLSPRGARAEKIHHTETHTSGRDGTGMGPGVQQPQFATSHSPGTSSRWIYHILVLKAKFVISCPTFLLLLLFSSLSCTFPAVSQLSFSSAGGFTHKSHSVRLCGLCGGRRGA